MPSTATSPARPPSRAAPPPPSAPDSRRTTATTASSSAGTASTQWCDHEIGDTSRLVTAHSANPRASSPARPARAASATPATPATAATGSHTGSADSVCSTRASAPSRLWLATFWIRPTCPGLKKLVSQYCAASPGTRTKASATVPANTAAAVAAARYRLVASR
jgi:hypothetical protein